MAANMNEVRLEKPYVWTGSLATIPDDIVREAAQLFDYVGDTKVLLRSEITSSEHWMPYTDALLVTTFYTARRIAFTLFVGDLETGVLPLFAFNGQGAFTGDDRALRMVERQNLIFEEMMRSFFE